MATKTKKETSSYSSTKTTRQVARFAWIFIMMSCMLTALIIYFTSVKTKITIQRNTYPIQATFVTTVSENPQDNQTQGTYEQKTVDYTFTNTNLQTTTETTEKAEGIIQITNDWTQNQPLQATTRFQSPDGKIFRSTERVDVPAGGTVNVHVIADEAGVSGTLPVDTHFTIPGLWQGLQDQIYGTSVETFSGGVKKIAVISATDIEQAKKDALAGLLIKAKEQLQSTDPESESYVLQTDLLLSQANATAGDKADSLIYSVRARYIALSIPSQTLYKLLYDKLGLILTDDEEITEIDLDALDITIEHVSSDSKSIQIRIHTEALAQLKETASLFSPVSLANKTQTELDDVATAEQGITSIQASFSPFWVKRTPMNDGRVTIDIH